MGVWVSQHDQFGAIPPPPFPSLSFWRVCEVEVRCPHTKGVSQRYLRGYPAKQGKMRAIPLRHYFDKVLRDLGGYLALGR